MSGKDDGLQERLAQAELSDDQIWEWARHKSLLKEAISEWVEENPAEGKQMITSALAAYIDGIVKVHPFRNNRWTNICIRNPGVLCLPSVIATSSVGIPKYSSNSSSLRV